MLGNLKHNICGLKYKHINMSVIINLLKIDQMFKMSDENLVLGTVCLFCRSVF